MPSPPPSTEPERYFLLAGTKSYPEGGEFAELVHVPDELKVMRRTLTDLGLTELFPDVADDDRDSDWLRWTLNEWLAARERERDGEEKPPPLRLLVYYTGHGYVRTLDDTWHLPGREGNPRHVAKTMVPAADLLMPALTFPVLDEFVLLLDACYAQHGVTEAVGKLTDVTQREATRVNFCVVSAASRNEVAKQLAFADAFAHVVKDGRQTDEYLVVEDLLAAVNLRLPAGQEARPITQRAVPSRMLPNPRHLPLDPPLWLDASWRGVARGVEDRDEKGWFFTGRRSAVTLLTEHLNGPHGGPLVVAGPRGCGKSALLGWAAVTGDRRMRERLPRPLRRSVGVEPGLVSAALRARYHHPVADAAREISAQLFGGLRLGPAELIARLADDPGRHGILVDLTHEAAAGGHELGDLLADLADLPSVRLVVAVRGGDPLAARPDAVLLRLDQLPDTSTDLRAYLRRRLARAPGSPYAQGPDGRREAENLAHQLAPLCRTSFRAAARAARELCGGGTLSGARTAIAGVLHSDLLHTLRDLRRDGDWAADLVAPLDALPDEPVPEDFWPSLASGLAGRDRTAQDVTDAVDAVGGLLTRTSSETGTSAWRLPVAPTPSPARVPAERVVAVLRDLVPAAPEGPVWSEADPFLVRAVLRCLPRAGTVRPYLLDHSFLLAAQPAPTDPAFAAADIRDVAEGLRAVCAALRARPRVTGNRGFLLSLLARRHGVTELVEDRSPEARWRPDATRTVDGAPMYRVSVTDGLAATAHDDGVVRLWQVPDLAPVGELPATAGRPVPSALALTVRQGTPVVAIARFDGGVDVWDPTEGRVDQVRPPDGRVPDSVSWTDDGRIVLPADSGWTVLDPVTGDVRSHPLGGGPTSAVRMSGGRAAVAAVRGRIQVVDVGPDGTPVRAGTPILSGTVHALSMSPAGTVVAWVGTRGDVAVHRLRATVGLPSRTPAMSVAAGDRFVAIAGDRWLRVYDADLGEVTDLPWDDAPTGVGVVGDLLVVQSASTLTVLSHIR
ncbi:hypothetical protein AB0K04_11340 [Micromonospora coxensis]|uniref:hypothetical protein n=1 Tax=Micromonospora coxensis TaxID=356852 RepID=UPI0034345CF1